MVPVLNSKGSVFLRLFLLGAVAGLFFGHFLLHQLSVPAESALRLSEASLMLDGAVPYVNFLDNASPFYIYFNIVPVCLSQVLCLHPILMLNWFCTLLFLLSAFALILLSDAGLGRAPWRNSFARCHWACLVAFILVVLLQPAHFAQANQLFFIVMTPYIVCRALRLKGLAVSRRLALSIGMAVGLGILLDPLYVIFLLLFELSIVFGLYPYTSLTFIKKRYFGPELKFAWALAILLASVFAFIPSPCARHYILDVIPINLDGYIELLNALCYNGNSSDLRPQIYLGGLFVMAAAPFLGRNIVARLFAVATLLSLALLIGQTGILTYQAYPMLAFGAMTFAAVLTPAILPSSWRELKGLSTFSEILAKQIASVSVRKPGFRILLLCLTALACSTLTYFVERGSLAADDFYDLSRIGYWGVADKRDIGVLGDVIELYSKPREAVAILGLGLRPAYPVLTQLRRRPGLALTWGFPLDILHIMQAPIYDKERAAVKDFSEAIYTDMIARLSAKEGAPVLVLIDEGEVRTLLDEHGVGGTLEANYVSSGGASLLDSSSTAGHPLLEYVGYKSGFGIYRHK